MIDKGKQRKRGSGNMTQNAMANFYRELPTDLVQAAVRCALPHWFTRSSALDLINFELKNTQVDKLLNNLLDLPFVYKRDNETWQYTTAARVYLLHRLEENPLEYKKLNHFLKEIFQNQWNSLVAIQKSLRDTDAETLGELTWEMRQIQWQLAYHWAPLDPMESMKRLIEISEGVGSNKKYVQDQNLAIAVWRTNERVFAQYRPEGVYLEGRYAYSRGDDDEAIEKLNYVWHIRPRDPLIAANAGHLLGVILRRKGQQDAINSAERILRESLLICKDKVGLNNVESIKAASRITNSLGATLVQSGDTNKVKDGITFLEESLALHQQLGDMFGITHTLNSIGTALIRLGDEDRLMEAEALFRNALEMCKNSDYLRSASMLRVSLATLLIHQDNQSGFIEAEKLLLESIKYAQENHIERHEALAHFRLAQLLIRTDDINRFSDAENYLQKSLAYWKKVSHRYGQRDTLYLLALILDRTDRDAEAELLRQEADSIPL